MALRTRAGARSVLRQGIVACVIAGTIMALLGIGISGRLPVWLGGDDAITGDASLYFLVFVSALPVLILNYLAGGMLRLCRKHEGAGGVERGDVPA